TGKIVRPPWGPAPSSWVGAVASRSVIRACKFMAFLRGWQPSVAPRQEAAAEPTAIPRTSLRRSGTSPTSDDLVDGVDGPSGLAIAGGDGQDAVEERVLRRARLEPRRGPEVVARRVHDLLAA